MTTTDRSVEGQLAAAQAYLDGQAGSHPVETARGRLLLGQGGTDEVLSALARYQNDDGGIGHGLEPDISAPQSNPFAARIALSIVLEDGIPPTEPLVTRLVDWLEDRQGEDGCWRWEPGTLDHPIAPWFAGWEFPNLNPAMDLSGILARLGLGSERLHRRCHDLYVRMASAEEMANGPYYVVLPYVESVPWLTSLPDRESALDTLAEHIVRDLNAGNYATPQEAADHIGPADGPLGQRMPAGTFEQLRAELIATQQPDGHWQSPFGPHWNPSHTLSAMHLLAGSPG